MGTDPVATKELEEGGSAAADASAAHTSTSVPYWRLLRCILVAILSNISMQTCACQARWLRA